MAAGVEGAGAGRRPPWRGFALGLVVGVVAAVGATLLLAAPLALAHRQDLPLERLYGRLAVEIALRLHPAPTSTPPASSARLLLAGRNAYTGSCAQCHGLDGKGRGMFGQALYPDATDLTSPDAREKSDAQIFWIIKNGLSFTGMPAFGDQYADQGIWALVAYTRALQQGGGGPEALAVPTPTEAQLAMADPEGDAVHRGAAVYFAQGCASCHGATGEAPGDLGLGSRERETREAVRRGRPGMPAYAPSQLTDAELDDLIAYMSTFPDRPRRFEGEGARDRGPGRGGARSTPPARGAGD